MECFEMYQFVEAGAPDLIFKANIKRWEYLLYGGRPELYPQDKKALLTLLRFKADKIEREERQRNMKSRLKDMAGRGIGFNQQQLGLGGMQQ